MINCDLLQFVLKDCSKIPSLKAKRLCKQQQEEQQQQQRQQQQKNPEDEWNFESFDTLVEVKELTGEKTIELTGEEEERADR